MKLHYRGTGNVYFNNEKYRIEFYDNKKKGGILIEIKSEKSRISQFKIPLELPYLCGQLDNGFMFTLLHLNRIRMNRLVSYRVTVYSYSAQYMLCGIGGNINYEHRFNEVEFQLSNIIEWGGESVFRIGEDEWLIETKDCICKTLYQGLNFNIDYIVFCSAAPITNQNLLKKQIKLKQTGVFKVCFKEEKKFDEFLKVFEKLKELIEITTLRRTNIEKVRAYSDDIGYDLGDTRFNDPIEIFGRNIHKCKNEEPHHNSWGWISLNELIEQNSFKHYFDKHATLSPIIDLYLEPSHYSNNFETRRFLNLVQALETYHSRFVTNDLKEFIQKVEQTIKRCSSWDSMELRTFLMAKSKSFITLESRIADLLLVNDDFYFDTGEIDCLRFPSIIARTRNYYIHYDEKIRKNNHILTEEELRFYNPVLFQILDYYILSELGFSDDLILKEKLIDRWGSATEKIRYYRDFSNNKNN